MKFPKFTTNQWIGISSTIAVLIVGFVTIYFQRSTNQISVQDSPNSINTIEQTGGTNIINNVSSDRNLSRDLQNTLVKRIYGYEAERNKKFEYIVLSASPDGESQKFARQIITFLTTLNRWKVVSLPIIIYRSNQSQSDIMFNLTEQFNYKNSLEIEIYDKK